MRVDGKNEEQTLDTEAEVEAEAAPAAPLTLSIDWDRYLHFLEDSDASDADKRALIECLWSIVVSFVDMDFRLSPIQEICGQIEPLPTAEAKDMVKISKPSTHRTFAGAADATLQQGRQA